MNIREFLLEKPQENNVRGILKRTCNYPKLF